MCDSFYNFMDCLCRMHRHGGKRGQKTVLYRRYEKIDREVVYVEIREFVCIGCPLGCNVTARTEGGEIVEIKGNTCPRGADYVTKELTDPRRIVTSLVRVKGGELPVVSVKTAADIPKDKISECICVLKGIELQAPVRIGDVVAEDVCGTGISVIATRGVAAG